MEPKALDENIAFLTGKATHLFYTRVSHAIREKKLNVTVEQFSVLTILWYEDGLIQQEIANRLTRDKTTLTRVINTMEKGYLVVRIPDKSDRRINRIYLTYRGKELQKLLTETTGSIYMNAIKGISAKELGEFINVMNKLLSNLLQIE